MHIRTFLSGFLGRQFLNKIVEGLPQDGSIHQIKIGVNDKTHIELSVWYLTEFNEWFCEFINPLQIQDNSN